MNNYLLTDVIYPSVLESLSRKRKKRPGVRLSTFIYTTGENRSNKQYVDRVYIEGVGSGPTSLVIKIIKQKQVFFSNIIALKQKSLKSLIIKQKSLLRNIEKYHYFRYFFNLKTVFGRNLNMFLYFAWPSEIPGAAFNVTWLYIFYIFSFLFLYFSLCI